MMHRAVIVLSVTLAAVAAVVSGDTKCVSVDEDIKRSLFESLRNELSKSNSEYIAVGDFSTGFFGIGVRWSGAHAGNFSSLALSKQPNEPAASRLCTTTTAENTVEKLEVNLGFETLEVKFGSFVIETPFLNIGGDGFTVALSGENLNVVVETTTETKAGTCAVNLDNFEFTNWGSLNVNFGGGIINWALTKIFNSYVSAYVVGLLKDFGVANTINSAVKTAAADIITSSGQAGTVCDLIKLLSS